MVHLARYGAPPDRGNGRPASHIHRLRQGIPWSASDGRFHPRGWGLGLGVVTTRRHAGDVPGSFGWDGAFGTAWHVDPATGLLAVLMTQRRPDVLDVPPLTRDFLTSAYQLVDD